MKKPAILFLQFILVLLVFFLLVWIVGGRSIYADSKSVSVLREGEWERLYTGAAADFSVELRSGTAALFVERRDHPLRLLVKGIGWSFHLCSIEGSDCRAISLPDGFSGAYISDPLLAGETVWAAVRAKLENEPRGSRSYVLRYSEGEWQDFAVPYDALVTSLASSGSGVWVRTMEWRDRSGPGKLYLLHEGEWTEFPLPHLLERPEPAGGGGLPEALFEDYRGTLWMLAPGGLLQYVVAEFEPVLHEGRPVRGVHSAWAAESGNWFVSDEELLWLPHDGSPGRKYRYAELPELLEQAEDPRHSGPFSPVGVLRRAVFAGGSGILLQNWRALYRLDGDSFSEAIELEPGSLADIAVLSNGAVLRLEASRLAEFISLFGYRRFTSGLSVLLGVFAFILCRVAVQGPAEHRLSANARIFLYLLSAASAMVLGSAVVLILPHQGGALAAGGAVRWFALKELFICFISYALSIGAAHAIYRGCRRLMLQRLDPAQRSPRHSSGR